MTQENKEQGAPPAEKEPKDPPKEPTPPPPPPPDPPKEPSRMGKVAEVKVMVGYFCPDCGSQIGTPDEYDVNGTKKVEAQKGECDDCEHQVTGPGLEIKTL